MAATKVFVGNFSFAIDDVQLRDYFSRVGSVVSAKVMTEGPTRRSRGFGFVEFSSAEEASRAITELDGSVWEGRVIKVSEDRTQRRYGDHGGPHAGAPGDGGDGDSGSPYGARHAPIGYFRAQPFDLGIRRKKKVDPILQDGSLAIDYKDPKLLSRFMSERGRILPRRMTGLSAAHQRLVTRAIKRAQHLALLGFTRS